MAPSVESILTNYLLLPSPLPNIISLEKFTELFPRALRSHPQIKTLYRELQHLRAQDIDLVRENISNEVQRGERQKQQLRNAIIKSGVSDMARGDQVEANLDVHLFGQPSSATPDDVHSLETLLPEMERSTASLEKEIETIEAETAKIMGEMSSTVGGLSDLRYGKLNKPSAAGDDFADETVQGLKRLEDICNRKEANK